MIGLKSILLVIGTLFIIWFSWWASIKEKRYHGIYRFFSFESILLLVLNNSGLWFLNPFSFFQCISWLLLAVSVLVALVGFYQLVGRGKPEGRFENTSELITNGMYRFIRHPLYCSLLVLGIGIFFKNPANKWSIILVIINTIAIYFTAKEEEKEMLVRFGDSYKAYLKHSKMFIPYLF